MVDNKDTLEELVTRTAERLVVVNTALVNEDEVVSRDIIERFAGCVQYYSSMLLLISCRILINKVLELSKMLERGTWKRILENEEDKTKIEETFKHIDEHTKNFHVRLFMYPPQSTELLMLRFLAQTHADY